MLARIALVLSLALLCAPVTAVFANADFEAAVFHIECPPDVTIDCHDDIYDLSPYGWAYVYGYGSPTAAGNPVVHYHINNCGSGYITRTWTAYDYQHNPHSCTQHIYVGGGGFGYYNIHWPPDYMTDDCNAHLDPDDLPAPFDYPTYDHLDCSQIMIAYEDLAFNFGGGCKKILRTWKLLDWCTYNPNYPNGPGRWEHTQIIKIKPYGNVLLNCPDDVVASAGANCSGTYVSITPATGTGACGTGVQITNNSPYASSSGADASGHYPYGTTYVKFTVDDACGNWESCTIKVTVKDMKKPTPICYHGLTANLMMNYDGYYIDLDAKWFNKGSYDNCTPDHKLKFRIEPKRFTCDQLGEQDVKVYVEDEFGNEQYCNTYVIIQDNMNMCPPEDTTTFSLSGHMTSLSGEPVGGLRLELMQDQDIIDYRESGTDGSFNFGSLTNSMNYMVKPEGDDSYTLGLSTFDLLILAKHIYDVKPMNSSVQMLAGDADQNGSIDVVDLIHLRKLLLHQTSQLPNKAAWRFVPTDLFVNHPDEIFNMTFNEYWTKNDLYENVNDIDFTAIKIGDVNGSVQFNRADERSQVLYYPIIAVFEEDRIDFIAERNIDLSGMQMEMNINLENMNCIEAGRLDIGAGNINLIEGHLLLSWLNSRQGIDIKSGEILFSIACTSDKAYNKLDLSENFLRAELYSTNETQYDISLNKGQQTQEHVQDEYSTNVVAFPNPAKSGSELVVAAEKSIDNVYLVNSQGRIVHRQVDINRTEIIIDTEATSRGLYLLNIELFDGTVLQQKVIIE